MLQRIQTIYILILIVLLFIAPFFSFTQFNLEEGNILFLASGMKGDITILDSFVFPNYVITGYLVSVSFSILMLVNYKKRSRQMRYGKLLYLIISITFCYMLIESYNLKNLIDSLENVVFVGQTFHIGFFLLVSSFPFLFLANRSIKKDEDLVKSLDRLR
tara:strand:- start:496 stop:975 length:480 start_codon:yes stop_codon:yes gene_type:complete